MLQEKLAAQENLQIFFLSPYNSELATIETGFAIIKAKMKRAIKKESWNFKKDEGKSKMIVAYLNSQTKLFIGFG